MRGKPLTKDPVKLAEEEHLDNLYKAIALIQQFAEGFSTITPEDLKTGGISALKQYAAESAEISKLTAEELFTRQFDKAKKSNPAVSQIAVAEEEEARASIMIEELEAIPGVKSFYKTDPRYKKITSRETGYLKFLTDILQQRHKEPSPDALNSFYHEKKLGEIFDRCTEKLLMKKSDRTAFISLFTTGFVKRIWYDTEASKSQVAIFDIMFRITGKIMKPKELKKYFDFTGTLRPNNRSREGKSGVRSSLGNDIFKNISPDVK